MHTRLEREGDSTCFTFRPGRHDPYNCSNSVIDGGACSDALATFVLAFGDRLPAEEREREDLAIGRSPWSRNSCPPGPKVLSTLHLTHFLTFCKQCNTF